MPTKVSKVHNDPCSLSNPEFYKLTHMNLDWCVDFGKKTILGSSLLTFELIDESCQTNEIILDTRDLLIKSVSEEKSNSSLEFSMGETSPIYGTPLHIKLDSLQTNERNIKIKISYDTSPNSSALQWIEPEATMGKRHPYLFSQCQAIHARSICPCQDTPGVKFTYTAAVTCSKNLVALMSACRLGNSIESENKIKYRFEQKIQIPSYLIAIVVADIVCKQIGPISNVWTEKEQIDAAAEEFKEIDDMIKAAESLVGEYVWGIYDLLVLPPSFPYGGMENPCLTFVTPTLIAKDKSLVSVIHHEIAHSWTGNLVTNCNWENFWLNEGFTKFLERKIDAILNKSEKFRQFECIDGWRILKKEVNNFGETNQLTNLCPCLKGIDPDESFSSIPYEKGHMFLYYLEELLGGVDIFNKYLKAYIERFKGMSIDTNEWKAFLYEYFSDQKHVLDTVDWNSWLYKPGMPPVTLKFDQTIAEEVKNIANKLINETIESDNSLYLKLETGQKLELLNQILEANVDMDKVQKLNDIYQIGNTENSEILFKWISIGIKARWKPIIPVALKFVSDQGRMKFTRPTYRELYKWDEAKDSAIQTFKQQKPFMHNTTASLVEKFELHLTS